MVRGPARRTAPTRVRQSEEERCDASHKRWDGASAGRPSEVKFGFRGNKRRAWG
jgi:hypothetical protein